MSYSAHYRRRPSRIIPVLTWLILLPLSNIVGLTLGLRILQHWHPEALASLLRHFPIFQPLL